jgi:hypothetical protein
VEQGDELVRIRTIKPEFWRSEDIAKLDWGTRLVYVGLWSYVDDNGVGRDDWRIITAELFALDDPLTEPSVRVQTALDTLSAGGQIVRYTVRGKAYIEILAWDSHQVINRPSKARFPRSDAQSAKTHGALTEPSMTDQNMPGAGTGEQGNRGTGEYKTSKSQSSNKRARVSTDSIEISEMTQRAATQLGIQIPGIVSAIAQRCDVDVDAYGALQVSRWVIDRSKEPVQAGQKYVLAAIDQSPAEIQKYIYEEVQAV